MTDTDSIVVIVPTIAIDDQLDLAVQSLLLGSFRDIRVIVVHDGVQPDDSRVWMSDTRVTVLQIPIRGGLVNGLITAIASSDEPLIARLDADDISAPGRIKAQAEYLQEHPETVLIASEAMRIDVTGQEIGPLVEYAADDVRPRLLERNFVVHSSVMFRRHAYDAAGGFDSQLPQMEDYELWLRMALQGPIAILPEPLVSYRLHPGQVSRAAKPYGLHVTRVNRARRALAAKVGSSAIRTHILTARWTLAQYLRYFKVRRPGYDRPARAKEPS